MRHHLWALFAGGLGLLLSIWLLIWCVVLWLPDPLNYKFATAFPWPVACTTRGCVTTISWFQQHQEAITYAQAFHQTPPTFADTLTTTVRKKLVSDATIKSSIGLADATKYRTEILNLTDEAALRARTGLSAQDYDKEVVVPFLQQESLLAQRKLESPDELYSQLAHEHWVLVPLRAFAWDSTQGKVINH